MLFLYSVLTKVFLLILIKKNTNKLKQTHTHASIIYKEKLFCLRIFLNKNIKIPPAQMATEP